MKYETVLALSIVVFLLLGAIAFGLLALFNRDSLFKESPAPAAYTVRNSYSAPAVSEQPVRKQIKAFPTTPITWKTRFANANPPTTGKFQAYYFDMRASSTWKTLPPHLVDSPDMKFSWYFDTATNKQAVRGIDSKDNISGENFGAYWISTLQLPAEELRDLYVVQGSAAYTRVIIDGRVVFDKKSQDMMVPLTIPAGQHIIEVEFLAHNPTVGVSVNLSRVHKINTPEHETALDNATPLRRWFAYVYESAATDNRIRVTVDRNSYPTGHLVLSLHSYGTVHWDLGTVPPHTIDEITITSYSGASDAINVPAGTGVYYSSEPDRSQPDFNHPDNLPGQATAYAATSVHLAEDASANTDH